MAAARAASGERAMDACRAASRAAASTEPWAIAIRPAAITMPISRTMTGARMTSSRAALPASPAAPAAAPLFAAPSPAPPVHGAGHGAVNLSTGPWATWLILIGTPGTRLGTWPVTVISMVVAVLPAGWPPGPSRYPDARPCAKFERRAAPRGRGGGIDPGRVDALPGRGQRRRPGQVPHGRLGR